RLRREGIDRDRSDEKAIQLLAKLDRAVRPRGGPENPGSRTGVDARGRRRVGRDRADEDAVHPPAATRPCAAPIGAGEDSVAASGVEDGRVVRIDLDGRDDAAGRSGGHGVRRRAGRGGGSGGAREQGRGEPDRRAAHPRRSAWRAILSLTDWTSGCWKPSSSAILLARRFSVSVRTPSE